MRVAMYEGRGEGVRVWRGVWCVSMWENVSVIKKVVGRGRRAGKSVRILCRSAVYVATKLGFIIYKRDM